MKRTQLSQVVNATLEVAKMLGHGWPEFADFRRTRTISGVLRVIRRAGDAYNEANPNWNEHSSVGFRLIDGELSYESAGGRYVFAASAEEVTVRFRSRECGDILLTRRAFIPRDDERLPVYHWEIECLPVEPEKALGAWNRGLKALFQLPLAYTSRQGLNALAAWVSRIEFLHALVGREMELCPGHREAQEKAHKAQEQELLKAFEVPASPIQFGSVEEELLAAFE